MQGFITEQSRKRMIREQIADAYHISQPHIDNERRMLQSSRDQDVKRIYQRRNMGCFCHDETKSIMEHCSTRIRCTIDLPIQKMLMKSSQSFPTSGVYLSRMLDPELDSLGMMCESCG